mgnify:CR=1 FL=1
MIRTPVKAMAVMCALTLCACGPLGEDLWGSYDGTSERYNATNFGMTTQTVEDVISVTPKSGSEDVVLVGLESNCVIEATFSKDGALSFTNQVCTFGATNSTDTWVYEGTGQVEDDKLTLELKGSFERVYKAGPAMLPPLEGNHRLTFSGTRTY